MKKRVYDKQCYLAQLAKTHGPKSFIVQNYQNQLVSILDFRVLAIYNASKNKRFQTLGIDKEKKLLKNEKEKIEMTENLRNLENYFPKAMRRVFIPKAKGKERLLGISTIKDRCVQSLFKLILEPVIETTEDKNSYSFRLNKSAHHALATIKATLKSYTKAKNIAILCVDIKNFFNNISCK